MLLQLEACGFLCGVLKLVGSQLKDLDRLTINVCLSLPL